MKFGPSTTLGIALTDRAITCAEVAPAPTKRPSPKNRPTPHLAGPLAGRNSAPEPSPQRAILRQATFEIPANLSYDQPQPLGQALAAFLRANDFGPAPRAAVGCPAKWLIALEKDVPPAAEDAAHGVLRMHAERLAVSESGEIVFDYAGTIDPAAASRVLLVGLPRRRLDQIDQLLAAAEVSPAAAVTSSALALGSAAAHSAHAFAYATLPMLLLSRQGGEIVWRREGADGSDNAAPRMLRHVGGVAVNGHGPLAVAGLGAELRRTLALTRADGAPPAREMLLWDDAGLAPDQVAELSERAGLRVQPGNASFLGLQPAPTAAATATATHPQTFAPALALALAAADRALLPVDFKRSRLAPRPARRLGRPAVLGIVAAAIAVLGIVLLYVDVSRRQAELGDISARIKERAADVRDARAVDARVKAAGEFFAPTRPSYLDCLKELSEKVFRDAEPDIWTTSFTLQLERRAGDPAGPEVRKATLVGKTTNSDRVNTLIARLKQNPKFRDTAGDWRDVGSAKSREYTYTITFTFVGTE